MNSISIIDYGIGNLLSVARAFAYFNAEVKLVQTPEEILKADRLVLPGVGAFADGIKGLQESQLIEPIKEFVKQGKPFMGICLGMQLMLSQSHEFGTHQGLNLIEGDVLPIPMKGANGQPHKIPHIGWNGLSPSVQGSDWEGTILNGLAKEAAVYFVHSYSVVPKNLTHRLADTDYNGLMISAVIKDQNIYGCQFHPEKSGEIGLKIIHNFLTI